MEDPKMGIYKGHVVLTLNPDQKFPFTFGLNKARMILNYIDVIQKFVSDNHQKED